MKHLKLGRKPSLNMVRIGFELHRRDMERFEAMRQALPARWCKSYLLRKAVQEFLDRHERGKCES